MMTAVTTRFYTSMAAALTKIVVLCWLLASKVEIYSFMAGSERCHRCEIRRQLYNGTRFQEYRPGLNVFSSLFTFAEVSQTLLRVRVLSVRRRNHFISWGGLWCFIVAEITIALHCSRGGAIACPTGDCDTRYLLTQRTSWRDLRRFCLLSKVVNELWLEYSTALIY